MIGRKLQYNSGRPNEVKIWGDVQSYALQTCVVGLQTEDPRPVLTDVTQVFSMDARVFVLNRSYYGCIGRVIGVSEGGSIHLSINARNDVDMTAARSNFEQSDKLKNLKWYPGWRIAQNLGISSYILSRITGVLYVFQQDSGKEKKRNIGLGLRSNRGKGGEVPGYTKRISNDDGKSEWQYSSELQQSIQMYIDEYPELIITHLHEILKDSEDKDKFTKFIPSFRSFLIKERHFELFSDKS